jgi:hypothetical protein
MRHAIQALAVACFLAVVPLIYHFAPTLLEWVLGVQEADPLLEELSREAAQYAREQEATPEADRPAVWARRRTALRRVYRRHGRRPACPREPLPHGQAGGLDSVGGRG